jgi:TonB-linked SusC/RagA family outer membrane protein
MVVALALGLVPAIASAQTTISGHVATDANLPLEGVSVSIPALSVGAYTNAQGNYSFTAPARARGQAVTITARHIGYAAKSATVTLSGGSITQDFALSAAPTQLTGIIVTALGIEREKSRLGTAVQAISNDELTTTKSLNIVEQLQGKVSGVQITSAGTQGGSTNIVIRGQNSITGNNQPLFIVDGVPVSNQARGGSVNGAYDFGSALSDLNPDDIENMSVLKGPNAAALYGSRASNGVVLITTKKGRNTGGRARTDAIMTYTMDRPSRLWDYQNDYGQGAGGEFSFLDGAGGGVHDDLDQSFGPRFKGQLIHQFTDGPDPNKKSPWVAYPNNVADFFNHGHTISSTISATGGTDRANARLSFGSDNVSGIIPNSFFGKQSGLLSGNLVVSDKFSTNATLQYIRNTARQRPGTGYNVGILEQFIWFGRNVDMAALKNYKLGGATNGGPDNREYNWNYNFHNNPWWMQYENPIADARDRFIASATAQYRLADWLNASLSTGSDIFRYNVDTRFAEGNLNFSDPSYAGAFSFVQDYRNENNTQLLFTANRAVGSHIQFNGTAGGNIRAEQATSNGVSTSGISVAGIYNVSNAAITPTNSQNVSRRQVNSGFGSAAFTYNNWWTVEGTARNDWSSTLPEKNNSYFYPSINTSLVLSDAVSAIRNHGISYLKLRASWAQVGNDAAPYQLTTVYAGSSQKFGGLPLFSLDNTIANPNLKPELTTSGEGGVELGVLDGRVTLDASIYHKSTRNQIFTVPISPASGFSTRAVNAGQIDNNGYEALLTLIPLRLSNGAEWTSTISYSHNKSLVVDLGKNLPDTTTIQRYVLGSTWSTDVQARRGEPYGAIFGYDFLRDSATNQIITSGGFTLRGPQRVVGNIQPKFLASFNNMLTYKNYSLNVLVDMRRGGQFFSVSNFFGDYAGITQASLQGREIDWDKPGFLVKGINCGTGGRNAVTTSDSKFAGYRVCPNPTPNTDTVTAEDHFQSIFPVTQPYILDDNWVKLREVRFGIDLPQRWANMLRAQSANIAVVGRNLMLWTNVPNIDPEFSYSTGNAGTFAEFAALPNPRSVGFSVRITP